MTELQENTKAVIALTNAINAWLKQIGEPGEEPTKAWLTHIGETDAGLIQETIHQCRDNPEALGYYQKRAEEPVKEEPVKEDEAPLIFLRRVLAKLALDDRDACKAFVVKNNCFGKGVLDTKTDEELELIANAFRKEYGYAY